eukprot:3480501-Pleurochrysis_carterae.AAC.2
MGKASPPDRVHPAPLPESARLVELRLSYGGCPVLPPRWLDGSYRALGRVRVATELTLCQSGDKRGRLGSACLGYYR